MIPCYKMDKTTDKSVVYEYTNTVIIASCILFYKVYTLYMCELV